MSRLSTEERFAEPPPPLSEKLRDQVELARERQSVRFRETGVAFNAAIPGGRVRDFCRFTAESLEHFRKLVDENTLTTRSIDRLAKVARTVADLDGSEDLRPRDLDSAARFVVGGILRDSF
ncbi:MAG: hypothetical protein ACK58T_25545 [Phycisphaerae bacterium]